MKKPASRYILTLIALAGIVLGMLLASLSFYAGFRQGGGFLAYGDSGIKDDPSIKKALDIQSAFRLVAKSIIPAVVNISTEIVVKQQMSLDNDPFFRFFGKDWFDFYFGDQPKSREFVQKTLGTGVIIDEEGFILTNFHVVKNATKIIVKLSNGREYKAKVVGTDPRTDMALIKIDIREKLPVAPMGDSDALEVGDWAIAIGNPFGLNETFTVGVVSAKGRSGVISDASRYENYIQTDAAINPGNSGGPLVNIQGEIIGINTAIATPSGGNVGVGFAIPINTARAVFKQLKDKGKVVRGWLGVSIQDLSPDLAKHFGREPNSGVLVADIIEKTPAAEAGMKGGDIIVEFNGTAIKEVVQLRSLVADTAPGARVKIKVIRDKKPLTLTIKIAELKDETAAQAQPEKGGQTWLGLKVEGITPQNASRFRLGEEKTGVVIMSVDEKSPAGEIMAGDIIRQINNTVISGMDDFRQFVEKYGNNESFLFVVKRQGRMFYISVDNAKSE